jgi:nucleoside 2-deoxyribosyltransferase
MKTIYLAGPDVFYRDAGAHFEALQARCRAHGLCGVPPSDGGPAIGGSADEVAERIYRANVALVRDSDGLLANLMPFRNALEPDSGTVFELGFAVALGKPVAGIVPGLARSYEQKVAAQCRIRHDGNGVAWDDAFGFMIEAFGQPLNLMLARSTPLFEQVDAALAHLARQFGARG